MKPSLPWVLGLAALLAAPLAAKPKAELSGVTFDQARSRLIEGNERFVKEQMRFPRRDEAQRRATAARPRPWVAVAACSDSRVAPEIVFDQGLGDLFVVRNLGNVVEGAAELASLEQAVRDSGLLLLLVLGHERCSAVKDAVRKRLDEKSEKEALAVEALRVPVGEAADRVGHLKDDALVGAAVETNVYFQMKQLLKKSARLREKVASGELRLEGAIFNADGGRVRWLGPHPSQAAILSGDKI